MDMTGVTLQPGAIEASLEETRARFNDAFNRGDPAAVASFWTDDGTLISPGGQYGRGRTGVAAVYEDDLRTFLRGTTSRFTFQSVRQLGSDHAFIDAEHELQNFTMPDGSRQRMLLHLVLLARKEKDGWKWLDARPYAYVPPPPALH